MKMLFLCLFTFLVLNACDGRAEGSDSIRPLTIITTEKKRHDFTVEVALTPAQQQRGLMNRTEMAKDAGMLFFFGEEAERSFWMKNTLIPLDMIFIGNDGTIIKVHDSAIPNDLTSVKSDGPASAVLELNGGVAKTLGIKPGDKVHHAFFGNGFN